ncbi:unnamed protein product [Amoebophrya sp. A25]|nr:unnamed protein product [Amoebophrya sp. A25]|eukprot:GSA25T00021429001.1
MDAWTANLLGGDKGAPSSLEELLFGGGFSLKDLQEKHQLLSARGGGNNNNNNQSSSTNMGGMSGSTSLSNIMGGGGNRDDISDIFNTDWTTPSKTSSFDGSASGSSTLDSMWDALGLPSASENFSGMQGGGKGGWPSRSWQNLDFGKGTSDFGKGGAHSRQHSAPPAAKDEKIEKLMMLRRLEDSMRSAGASDDQIATALESLLWKDMKGQMRGGSSNYNEAPSSSYGPESRGRMGGMRHAPYEMNKGGHHNYDNDAPAAAPGQVDRHCFTCSRTFDFRRTHCDSCRAPLSIVDSKQNNWECPCGNQNWLWRKTCRRCQKPKPLSMPSNPTEKILEDRMSNYKGYKGYKGDHYNKGHDYKGHDWKGQDSWTSSGKGDFGKSSSAYREHARELMLLQVAGKLGAVKGSLAALENSAFGNKETSNSSSSGTNNNINNAASSSSNNATSSLLSAALQNVSKATTVDVSGKQDSARSGSSAQQKSPAPAVNNTPKPEMQMPPIEEPICQPVVNPSSQLLQLARAAKEEKESSLQLNSMESEETKDGMAVTGNNPFMETGDGTPKSKKEPVGILPPPGRPAKVIASSSGGGICAAEDPEVQEELRKWLGQATANKDAPKDANAKVDQEQQEEKVKPAAGAAGTGGATAKRGSPPRASTSSSWGSATTSKLEHTPQDEVKQMEVEGTE